MNKKYRHPKPSTHPRRILPLAAVLFLGTLWLNACTPDDSTIQTLVAQGDHPILTSAARTVSALLTEGAYTQTALPPSPTYTRIPTRTVTPSPPPTASLTPTAHTPYPTLGAITPSPTTTSTITPTINSTCNHASFVEDINIPDGTLISPEETFVKVWRLKNTGTCAWTTEYQAVFQSGAQMEGRDAFVFSDRDIQPGETVDILVELVAPDTPGEYKGYWILRDSGGNVFGLFNDNTAFYVEIVVEEDATHTAEQSHLAEESGSIRADAIIRTGIDVGDDVENNEAQVFLSFDISSIPEDAILTYVSFDFSGDYEATGDPFTDLGCLRAYLHDYGDLDVGDFYLDIAINPIMTWCLEDHLTAPVVTATTLLTLQESLGDDRLQMRLQFNQIPTDDDNEVDLVRFREIILTVSYTLPEE